jgi:hypothetical protein
LKEGGRGERKQSMGEGGAAAWSGWSGVEEKILGGVNLADGSV